MDTHSTMKILHHKTSSECVSTWNRMTTRAIITIKLSPYYHYVKEALWNRMTTRAIITIMLSHYYHYVKEALWNRMTTRAISCPENRSNAPNLGQMGKCSEYAKIGA